MEGRVSRLEANQENMSKDIGEMKDDLRAIRDAVIGARGGWKLLAAGIGLATAVGTAIGSLLPWLHLKL